MVRLAPCLLLALAALAFPANAQAVASGLFDAPKMTDEELAAQRGGFELPGGIQIALAARITTDVDGVRLLYTVLQFSPTGNSAAAQIAGQEASGLDPHGASVVATLPGLTVEHIIGQRIGSVISNTADNRIIDHQVSIDLSLSNVQPLGIGSAVFRVQSLGIDAGIWRASGG
jgi:hypothetical protein